MHTAVFFVLLFLFGISASTQYENRSYRSAVVASDRLICSRTGRRNGHVDVLDAREVAPLAATVDMFNGSDTDSKFGGLAIAVPGSLSGMQVAHRKYGVLPWSELFESAIKLSRDGFPAGEHMVRAIQSMQEEINEFPELRNLLWNSEAGRFYEKGEMMKNPKLSETLSELARDGADSFYRGKIAKRIVRDIQKAKGIITKEDLQIYRPKWDHPVQAELPGQITMNSFPLPASGGVLAFILNVMKGYSPKPFESLEETVLFYHRAIETFKYAYAKRLGLEDSEKESVQHIMKLLTSDDFADWIRKRILDDWTFHFQYHYLIADKLIADKFASNYTINDHGTSHLTVVAENGDAVSVTSTINNFFGSMVISPSTGILLNDEMDDFSSPNIKSAFNVPPITDANHIYPGRRPLSSMVPSIFLDQNGDVKLVIGASGGTKITTSVALVAMKTLWLNESISKAINEPRLHHQLFPMGTDKDADFPKDVNDGLTKLGHVLEDKHTMASGVVGILRGEDGLLYGGTDYRKGGGVAGY